MKNNQQNILFPENTKDAIDGILAKYGLEESDETILKKIMGGKASNGSVIAKIMVQIATQTISLEGLTNTLKNELGITGKKLDGLAKELKEQTISLVKEGAKMAAALPSEKFPLDEKREMTESSDLYREPIE